MHALLSAMSGSRLYKIMNKGHAHLYPLSLGQIGLLSNVVLKQQSNRWCKGCTALYIMHNAALLHPIKLHVACSVIDLGRVACGILHNAINISQCNTVLSATCLYPTIVTSYSDSIISGYYFVLYSRCAQLAYMYRMILRWL